MHRIAFCLLLALLLGGRALADQRVSVPVGEGDTRASLVDKGFAAALPLEVQGAVGGVLAPSRLKAVTDVLAAERNGLLLGYREIPAADANATSVEVTYEMRIDGSGLRNRLRDLGVLSTASGPKPYVLDLSGVAPAKTKRLGALQELTGVKPVPAAGEDVPVLRLSESGAWTGVLSQGAWSATQSARKLDDVWLALWKAYFSRPDRQATGASGLEVRISGWLSSMGPMEFDRFMDSWTAEIDRKSLVGVQMEGAGMAGVWRVQARSRDAFVRRLDEAAKAQGLKVEVR